MRRAIVVGVMLAAAGAALAQSASVPMQAIPNPPSSVTEPVQPKAAPAPAADVPQPPPAAPQGGTVLLMRGLEKITGRPTNITAVVGKPVNFATLTITARFCYSTPASETPETTAFVQIDEHRPDQGARRIFSGWMYGSSPGLNAVEHPLYDVWVISCNNNAATVAANASNTTTRVAAPDSSDKEGIQALPEGAGQ